MPPRALVVTVVHHPDDARIRYRQIPALLDAGWQVTYAAPFRARGLPLADPAGRDALTQVDLPRSRGRRRLPAIRATRRLLRRAGPAHDVVLLHDPELLLALPGLRGLPPVVWDVHEDTAAALSLKSWLPAVLRRPVASAVRRAERVAERRVGLLLAEDAYQGRFARPHAVVRNTVRVPATVDPPGASRVVYLGHVSLARGAREMAELGAALAADGIELVVIGAADAPATTVLREAEGAGSLRWTGFVPSEDALPMLDGALAGLSLLHDEPNYRASMPTKVVEYMAHGVPVLSTPLPVAADLVTRTGAGVVVPFGPAGVVAAADVLRELAADPERRHALGAAGHAAAGADYDWTRQADAFVTELARLAREAPS